MLAMAFSSVSRPKMNAGFAGNGLYRGALVDVVSSFDRMSGMIGSLSILGDRF